VKGTVAVTKARVMARDKDRTKASEDRTVALCPRALEVLKRQLALRERWQRLGVRVHHEHVFFKGDGEPIRHLHYGRTRPSSPGSNRRCGARPRIGKPGTSGEPARQVIQRSGNRLAERGIRTGFSGRVRSESC
jgi:hypothetical protein